MSCDHDWQDTSLHNAENGLPIVRCARCDLERDDGRTDADAIELAYGLLWATPVDTDSGPGWLASQARKVLLEQLDRAGQARGITAARALIRSRKTSRARSSLPLSVLLRRSHLTRKKRTASCCSI